MWRSSLSFCCDVSLQCNRCSSDIRIYFNSTSWWYIPYSDNYIYPIRLLIPVSFLNILRRWGWLSAVAATAQFSRSKADSQYDETTAWTTAWTKFVHIRKVWKILLLAFLSGSGRARIKNSRFLGGFPNIFDIVQPIVTEVRNALQPVINAAVVTAIDLFLQPVSVDRLLTAVENSNKLKPLVMNIVEFVLEKYTLSVKGRFRQKWCH